MDNVELTKVTDLTTEIISSCVLEQTRQTRRLENQRDTFVVTGHPPIMGFDLDCCFRPFKQR